MVINTQRLLNEDEAARVLGLSIKTLQKRRWLRQEPRFLKVGRLVKYRLEDLQAFLNSCVIEPREV